METSLPHPLLHKLGSVSKQYTSIVDGNMKTVFKLYFVENQTMKASAKFLETVEVCRKRIIPCENFPSKFRVM